MGRVTSLTMSLMTVVLVAVCASACTRSATGRAVGVADAGCAPVSTPLMPVTPRDEVEPVLRIPLPGGWQHRDWPEDQGIRWSMWSTKLARDGYTANAWLIMDSGITVAETPEAELERQGGSIAVAAGGATNVHAVALRVCGHPAMLFRYHEEASGNVAEHDSEVLAVAAESAGTVYVARLALSAKNCDHPQYRRDADTIVRGFEMVLRGAING